MRSKSAYFRTAVAAAAICAAMVPSPSSAATLTHRWSFAGDYSDSVGTSHGFTQRWPSTGSGDHPTNSCRVSVVDGRAVLAGGGGAGYLNLGAGVVETDDATLEVWVTPGVQGSWAYMFAYGVCDVKAGQNGAAANDYDGFFTCSWALAQSTDNDRMARNELSMRHNGVSYVNVQQQFGPFVPGVAYHVSLTFRRVGGDTVVRWVSRNASTGAVLSEKTVTATGWTATAAAGEGWSLTLGHNPWCNGTQDSAASYDEVRVWNGVLTDDQIAANIVAGPDSVPVGGRTVDDAPAGFDIAAGSAFTVGRAGIHWTSGTVSVGEGSSIVFDTAAHGCASPMKFVTGGFVLPEVSSNVLDFVTLTDPVNYSASVDGGTITVSSAQPAYARWTAASAPSSAADFSVASNWTCYGSDGATVVPGAVPGPATTLVIDGGSAFSMPVGVAPAWGRVLVGGHSATKMGRRAGSPNFLSREVWIDRPLQNYADLSDTGIEHIRRSASAGSSPSGMAQAVLRFDGWVHVPACRAGYWRLSYAFDDVLTFALDGVLVFAHPTYRYGRTSGCYVSEGWHRFTVLAGDTGGGYGAAFALGQTKHPFVVSVNGGPNAAFGPPDFTFGTDAASTVTLAADTDWRAFGDIALSSAVTIDLNGHSLVVSDISADALGARVVNGAPSGAALYVSVPPLGSKAVATGVAASGVPVVQYGVETAVWTGAAGDGDPLSAGNWRFTDGTGAVVGGRAPDASTAVTIFGGGVDMQVPCGSAFRCASLNVGDCSFAADCDWRGLAVTPTITGTADLNGHALRLLHLSAVAGAAISNGGDGVSAVKFDADRGLDTFAPSHYVNGLGNLATAENARIVIEKGGPGEWDIPAFAVGAANSCVECLVSGGSLVSAVDGSVTVGSGVGSFGILSIVGDADVTLGDAAAWTGVTVAGGVAGGRIDISGGRLTSLGWVDVGWGGNASAEIRLDGGEHVSNCSLEVGRGNGGTGRYVMDGGTFRQVGGHLHVGQVGGSAGYFVQSGGEAHVTVGNFTLAYNAGSSGTFRQTGGTLNSSPPVNVGGDGSINGSGGEGVFEVGGTVNADGGVRLGGGATGSGTLVVAEGGVLRTASITRGAGAATVRLAGGTLAPNVGPGANLDLSGIGEIELSGNSAIDVGADGDVSITNSFSAASGSSLVKTGAGRLSLAALPPAMVVSNGILAVSGDCDNSSAPGRVLELAGGTLALGGHTLRQPVVKACGGAVAGGTLVVTDSLVVSLADCMAGNCVAASGTVDLSGARLILEDPETLGARRVPVTFVRAAPGGVSFVGMPECARLPAGWAVSVGPGGAKLVRDGFSVRLRKP